MIIEVMDGRGGVRARTRLERLPATIGRALHNDVVLDDPHVDAEHLRVTRDEAGAIVISDLGSVNGTAEVHGAAKVNRVAWRPGLALRIGRTTLRFRAVSEGVTPATPLHMPKWAGLASSRKTVGIATVAALFLLTIYGWLGSYEENSTGAQFGIGVAIAFGIATWAGIWAVASRLARHEFHFLGHFAAATIALLAFVILGTIGEWAEMFTPFLLVDDALWLIGGGAIMIAWLTTHAGLASTLPLQRRLVITGAIVGSVMVIGGIASLAGTEVLFSGMAYPSALKPVPPSMVSAASVEEFVKASMPLRGEVDSLARRADDAVP